MKTETVKKLNWVLILFSFVFVILNWTRIPPEIPLFYSRPWGEEQLASRILILILPGLATLITLVNHFLATTLLRTRNEFFLKVSSFSSLTVTFLFLLTLLKIIFLIT